MPSLRHIASLLALSVLPSAALESAKDLVSIKNNTVLLADITSIHPDGTVTLNSPLSEAPLTIRPNALEQIVFKKSKPIEHDHKERIYLKNGDNLPCTLISLDDKNATFTTWYADKFSIPRDQILSISFDNKAESILFSSPHDVAKWKKNENWKSEENALKINGRGIASNSFELPANFIIDFSLEWSGLNPRFKCNFCGNDASTGHSERYFLDFNTAGVQITRGSAQGFTRIAHVPLDPEIINDKSIKIQILVDRKNQQVGLNINGKDVGTFDDASVSIPRGNFITLESNMNNEDTLSVNDLKILDWGGNVYKNHDAAAPNKPDSDTLFGAEGQSFSGKTLEILRENGKLFIQFASKHAKNPLKIPSDQTTSLYLQKGKDSPAPATRYWSALQGGGRIAFSSLDLNAETINAEHPILGKFTLKRDALINLSLSAQ